MKKILLWVLCLTMIAGCGGQSESAGQKAKNGDVVKIDYVGKKDGIAFQGGTAKNSYIELGSKTFIDGFEDQIVGMKVGNEKKIDVTFPSNYGSAELAGQKCTFDITLHAICEEIKDDVCKNGDAVKIDYVGKLDGVAFDGGSANGFLLVLGSKTFINGFEDQLVGMKTGENKLIKVTFPSNYGSTTINGKEVSLANKEVTFDVGLNHIYRESK